jgi:hypothetical protein
LRTPPGPAGAEPDVALGETAVVAAGLADRSGAAGLEVEVAVAVHPATATVASKPSQPSIRRLTMIVRIPPPDPG